MFNWQLYLKILSEAVEIQKDSRHRSGCLKLQDVSVSHWLFFVSSYFIILYYDSTH